MGNIYFFCYKKVEGVVFLEPTKVMMKVFYSKAYKMILIKNESLENNKDVKRLVFPPYMVLVYHSEKSQSSLDSRDASSDALKLFTLNALVNESPHFVQKYFQG